MLYSSFLFIIQRCDTAIITKYRIDEEGRDPDVLDEVTITADEVSVEQNCTSEWTTFYRIKPAAVSFNYILITPMIIEFLCVDLKRSD